MFRSDKTEKLKICRKRDLMSHSKREKNNFTYIIAPESKMLHLSTIINLLKYSLKKLFLLLKQ